MDRRVETAFELVRLQRKLVETTKVGSPANRQASDVLALIEESHFLLSELRRLSSTSIVELAAVAEPTRPPTGPFQSSAPHRRLEPLQLVFVFLAALVSAAVFWEVADPAPMDIQASEVAQAPLRR